MTFEEWFDRNQEQIDMDVGAENGHQLIEWLQQAFNAGIKSTKPKELIKCERCGGIGLVARKRPGKKKTVIECSDCKGRGRTEKEES